RVVVGVVDHLPGIGGDLGADVAGHDHRAFDVRGGEPQVGDHGLGEALHRELRRRVGGVGDVRAQAGPEAVDAGGVDDVRLVGVQHHRQEGAHAEVNPAPADVEGALPL